MSEKEKFSFSKLSCYGNCPKNYYLTYIGFNDIFEGDTKYYKDSQTFLKRAKEVQGSGVPYGLIDYNMNLSAPRTQVLSRLNEEKFVRDKCDPVQKHRHVRTIFSIALRRYGKKAVQNVRG